MSFESFAVELEENASICSDSEILRQDLVLDVNSDKSSSRFKSLTTIGPVETMLNAEKAVDATKGNSFYLL